MKTFVMYLFFVLPLVFAACTEDDDDIVTSIVGTWESTGSLPKEVSVTGNNELKVRIGDGLIDMSGDGTTLTFYDDGRATIDGSSATYSVSGSILTITYSGGTSVSSEVSIASRMLTIHEDVTDEYAARYPDDEIDKVVVSRLFGKK